MVWPETDEVSEGDDDLTDWFGSIVTDDNDGDDGCLNGDGSPPKVNADPGEGVVIDRLASPRIEFDRERVGEDDAEYGCG